MFSSNCHTASGFISTYVVLLKLWEIWKFRCAKHFDSRTKSVKSIISDIRSAANVAVQGMIFKKECSFVLQQFGFKPTVKLKVPKLVRWIPPQYGFNLNVDGACKGNTGPCGGGGFIRDSNGDIHSGFTFFYGQGNNMIAEVRTLCDGLRLAEHHRLSTSTVNSDSLVLVQSFYSDKCPSWTCSWWWRIARSFLHKLNIKVVHAYREANRVEDSLASFACERGDSSVYECVKYSGGLCVAEFGCAAAIPECLSSQVSQVLCEPGTSWFVVLRVCPGTVCTVEVCVVFLDTLIPMFELYVRLRERRQG
ncbi:hypothetical protein Taro_001904 [Colocasia esculenta]|uniref:RNase H type-1 domain-containing protein n=1 Tax=Colocasia esculenta TaxID=4460 RepID=A0A843TJD4_COLES|nr:hypothetical protein [Colocasia esculenta]